MPRFLVFHKAAQEIHQDEIIKAAQTLQRSLPENSKWLNSWVVPSEYRMICEWEAPDEGSVRTALKLVERFLPVEAVYEVEHIEPNWYK